MNIHEYQAKEILSSYGIPIPRGRVAMTSDQVERAAKMMGGAASSRPRSMPEVEARPAASG